MSDDSETETDPSGESDRTETDPSDEPDRTETDPSGEPDRTETDPSGEPEQTVRVWLVTREYTPRDLIVLEYATLDGERYVRKEKAARVTGGDTTAAIDVSTEKLAPTDPEDVDRFRDEARRMQDEHDPDDEI